MDNTLSSISGNSVSMPAERSQESRRISGDSSSNNLPQDSVSLESAAGKTAPSSGKTVKVQVLPQDPMIEKPVVTTIEKAKIGENLTGPRVVMQDKNYPTAIPDLEGNFFFDISTPQFNQVNAFVTTTKTLDMHERYFGHSIPWAFSGDRITVLPHARKGANAYYLRTDGTVNLMFFDSKELGKTVFAAQAPDITSHELSHAVLDGVRPKFMNSWNPETLAFHEAFADCSTLLSTLLADENLEATAKETGGDFTKNNRLAMLAEEFGKAMKLRDTNPENDNETFIRTCLNDYKYSSPFQLPIQGTDEELTSEAHSFCRVFTGAFYDLIGSMTEQNMQKNGGNVVEALRKTRDTLGPLLAKAVDLSPTSDATFESVALGMLKADQLQNGGAHKKLIEKAFGDRYILSRDSINKDTARMENLKDVRLPGGVTSETDALAFLSKHKDQLNLAGDYSQAVMAKDDKGNTIIQYSATQEIPLKTQGLTKLADMEGEFFTEVNGGATLAFDKDGNLVSLQEQAITPEKVRQTTDGIARAQERDLIRRQPLCQSDNLFRTDDIPYQAEVYQEPSGRFVVRRIPVIID